jgi:hypothetical protein
MMRTASLVILGAGLAACGGSDSSSPNLKWTGTIIVTGTAAAGTACAAGQTQTITITATGATPASVTVPGDGCVEFVNMDSIPHEPSSSPHPTHGCLPDFNPNPPAGFPAGTGPVLAANGGTFTTPALGIGLTAAGKTCGWHDHLNPPPVGSPGGY